MSNFDCCVKSLCENPANPYANLSAEGPDIDYFIGRYHGNLQDPPRLGWQWSTLGCLSWCLSAVSQEEANLCAIRQQLQCTTQDCEDADCDGEGGGGGWRPPTTGGGFGANPHIFASAAQTANGTCPDGLNFAYTLPAGTVHALSQAQADAIAQSLASNRANARKICLSSIATSGCVGSAYTSAIEVTGGTGPYLWTELSGSLPPGLSITEVEETTAQLITGTPTTAGTYSFTFEVLDSAGAFMVKTFTITVLSITGTPSSGNVGVAYSFTPTVTGGTAPYVWSVSSGALPTGLSLNSATGAITGTPTTSESANFTLKVVDSSS